MVTMLTACTAGLGEDEPTNGSDELHPKDMHQDEQQDQDVPSENSESTEEVTIEPSTARPVAVVVSNDRAALPLVGLQEADVVFEVLSEASITRFVAIYQSEYPERIGPIRSAREAFIDVALGHDPLFIAHGFSPGAEARLYSEEIDQLNGMDYDGTLFARDSERAAPHNSFVRVDELLATASEHGINTEMMVDVPFSYTEDELQGEAAEQIVVSYQDANYAEYRFNENENVYVRYNNGDPLVDGDTMDAYEVDNLLIVEAPHAVIDDAGRRHIDFDGGGNGLLIRDGKSQEIQWKNENNQIELVDESLALGNTWVNVVPSLQSVTIYSDLERE
ncbi:hypothetical protein DH09_19205 [Bacillaceae bacterium JMAK1]|nr:hypothetical protein DH09_19205 [Bacillaceae bacterium JMAK1]